MATPTRRSSRRSAGNGGVRNGQTWDGNGWRQLENGARIQCLPTGTITFNFLGTGTGGTIGLQASTGNAVRYVIVGSTGRVRSSVAASSGSCA